MRRPSATLVLVAMLAIDLVLLAPAGAKDGKPEVIPLPPVPPAAIDITAPPYLAKIDRLAELMGTLAFLRDLCGAGDGATWRGRMDQLLTAEGTTPSRRDRLAGSYNRGYAGYQLTYRSCTPAAETAIARALSAGAAAASEVSTSFAAPPR